jgi:hypothetical protein
MLTWHTTLDNRTCPICAGLDGYTWTFTVGQDEFPSYLQHPTYGLVWYVWGGSHAHGHQRYNCRCHITTRFDFSDLVAKIQKFHDQVMFASITAEEASNEFR